MLPAKVAALLLVLAIVSMENVSGGCCGSSHICTQQQKDDLVKVCKPYIVKWVDRTTPTKTCACCQEVRKLQGIDEGITTGKPEFAVRENLCRAFSFGRTAKGIFVVRLFHSARQTKNTR
jgi:hypothetical protein